MSRGELLTFCAFPAAAAPAEFELAGLPFPTLLEAVFADGRRLPITGWYVLERETVRQALERTAREAGAVSVEIRR